jgi:hypothetical protein
MKFLSRNVKLRMTCIQFDLPTGYPMGMGTRRVWVWVKFYNRGYGYEWKFVPIDYTGMGMVLLYPAHTLPIAILRCDLRMQQVVTNSNMTLTISRNRGRSSSCARSKVKRGPPNIHKTNVCHKHITWDVA